MKRVLPTIVAMLFLAGIFIVPVGVPDTPARLQETNMQNDIPLEEMIEQTWLPPDRTIRLAIYNETNSTLPSYMTPGSVMSTDYTALYNLFVDAGYDVTRLTFSEIQNHELLTAYFDVLLLADNCPRENITDYVREFWLSGGSILSIDSSIGYLGYAGILPRETLGVHDGAGVYWKYRSGDNSNVTSRHPVTKAYQIGEQLPYATSGIAQNNWTALMTTSIASELTKLVIPEDDNNWTSAIAMAPTDMGGKVVHCGIPGTLLPVAWENLLVDAVEWLCPRPKARIAFDLSHTPYYGLDDYDQDYCTSTSLTHTQMRNELVIRGYTFDKLYPPDGGVLTSLVLALYDLIIFFSPSVDFTAGEVTAVTDWIDRGGSILAITDHVGVTGVIQVNNLLSNTGLTHNMTHGGTSALVQHGIHPTHEGSSDMSGAAVGLVVCSGTAVPTWDDDQGQPVIGADELGNGRVILAPDQALFRDGRLTISDNLPSLVSMVNWLTSGNANVLVFVDSRTPDADPNDNRYAGPVAQALNELGISWCCTGFDTLGYYFNLSLNLYEWDLVIIDQIVGANLNNIWGELLDYVKSGERIIYHSSQLNQVAGQDFRHYVGINYVNNYIYSPPPIHFWSGSDPRLTIPRNYGAGNITTNTDYTFNYCQNLTYYDNATILGGISATKPVEKINATLVLGVEGNVLVNGAMLTLFENDTDDSTYPDNFELWENEIAFMLRPVLDSPSDMTIEVGSRTESIVWNAYSSHPDHYTIVRNSFEFLNVPWDGGTITLPLEEDNLGTEEFHLTVYDTLGFSVSDTVAVTKEDTTAPSFVDAPDNNYYDEGTEHFYLNWSFTEMNPDYWILYINGSVHDSDSWDGSEVSVDAGGLTEGVYNATIVVNDTSGNSAESTVWLTVNTPPTTTTTTSTTTTTTTTTTTPTESGTPTPPPGNNTLLIIIIAAVAGIVVIIIIIVLMKKKS